MLTRVFFVTLFYRSKANLFSATKSWKLATTSTKPIPNSLISEPGLVHRMINDFEEFFRSKKWYLRRSIPYRRGYLLVSLRIFMCWYTTSLRPSMGHPEVAKRALFVF
jgi:chaperone BCS1